MSRNSVINPQLLKPVGSFIWKIRYDVLLLSGSSLFFLLFVLGSLNIGSISGIDRSIATLVSGDVQRKPNNTKSFVAALAGSQFANMDAIWVGKGSKAKIKFD